MNEGKQKFIGGVDFDELRAQRVQLYHSITIDLTAARTNEEMVFTGNYVYALEATDVDTNFDIRFNELFRAVINIKKGRGVRIPFYRFYITNTAQAGKTLTIAIGIEASDFEVFDAGKSLGITGAIEVYDQRLDGAWATEGQIVDPATNTVLADTGPLPVGTYDFTVIASSTVIVGVSVELQYRNAANAANLKAQLMGIRVVNQFYSLKVESFAIAAANERLRVEVIAGGITGTLQYSIFWSRRA